MTSRIIQTSVNVIRLSFASADNIDQITLTKVLPTVYNFTHISPCAWFTDGETTFTICQPIHHAHGSSVFWGLPCGTMCTIHGSWNHFHHPPTNSPCAPSARIVSVLESTLWHYVHHSRIVKLLSPSDNQFTMRTIRTDRQYFGVYPVAPCAPFTDRETTSTIRQPIHHAHHPHGSSVFWGLPCGTMCTIHGSWNHFHHPSTNSPSALIVHMVYGSWNQFTISELIHHLHNVVTKSTICVVSWYWTILGDLPESPIPVSPRLDFHFSDFLIFD
jgi:hypothetical protein